MKVIDGNFKQKVAEDPLPMGQRIQETVADPMIANLVEGTFALIIDSEETGIICLTSLTNRAELHFLLAQLNANMVEGTYTDNGED